MRAGLPVPGNAVSRDAGWMLIIFIILILLMLGSFGGGFYQPAYRTHGTSLGTVLLIVLVLWALGVFGSRPF
jgi:hypothetical protein